MHQLTPLNLLGFLGLTALLACSPRPPAPAVFRDTGAAIYSSTVVEVARLQGRWVQVAGFAGEGMPCGPGVVEIVGGQVRWSLCLDKLRSGEGAMVSGKPGRFTVEGMPDWWVLWLDGDARTMVVGTPGGQFGFVLNREAGLPGDRATAVRDILGFNGYDLGKLRFY